MIRVTVNRVRSTRIYYNMCKRTFSRPFYIVVRVLESFNARPADSIIIVVPIHAYAERTFHMSRGVAHAAVLCPAMTEKTFERKRKHDAHRPHGGVRRFCGRDGPGTLCGRLEERGTPH